jgi:hypothetical protein
LDLAVAGLLLGGGGVVGRGGPVGVVGGAGASGGVGGLVRVHVDAGWGDGGNDLRKTPVVAKGGDGVSADFNETWDELAFGVK